MTGGVTELSSGGVDYVVRTEPTGLMESPVTTLSSIASTFTALRRLVRRDRTWAIAIRRRSDDPFGPTVHREVLPSREDAVRRTEDILSLVQAGNPPWPQPRT